MTVLPPFRHHSRLVNIDLASLVLHVCVVVTVTFDWVDPQKQHMSYDAK